MLHFQPSKSGGPTTRTRGANELSLSDLVLISNDDFIDNIEYLSPLGKSDHNVLSISCKI